MVFEYLDASTLKKCRLVSHLWNGEAARKLSKRTFIQVQTPLDPKITENYKRIASLHGLLKKSSSAPFLFKTIKTHLFLSPRKKVLADLYNEFGNHITNLTIMVDNSLLKNMGALTSEEREQCIYQCLTTWCPNLLNLELDLEVGRRRTKDKSSW